QVERRNRRRGANPRVKLTQARPERPPQDQRHRNDQHDADVGEHHIPRGEANRGRRRHFAFSSRLAVRLPTNRSRSSTGNVIDSSTMDMAAAPVRSSFSIKARIHWDDTSVLPGTWPPMVTTDPNSPMQRENANPPPDNSAGSSDGSTIDVK